MTNMTCTLSDLSPPLVGRKTGIKTTVRTLQCDLIDDSMNEFVVVGSSVRDRQLVVNFKKQE